MARTVYEKEYERYSDLQIKNLLNQDTVFVQLSVGLLAALVTLGKAVLIANKALGYITVVALSLTIVQVLTGYYASNAFFIHVKSKITQNNQSGDPVGKGLKNHWSSRVNNILNHTQYISFLIAMVSFIILVLLYVGNNDDKRLLQPTQPAVSCSQGWSRHHGSSLHDRLDSTQPPSSGYWEGCWE